MEEINNGQIGEEIRSLINKNKTRFIDRKYTDLSYITPRIIEKAFPGDSFYGLIPNNIVDVSNFLKERHGNNYLVINLSGNKYIIQNLIIML